MYANRLSLIIHTLCLMRELLESNHYMIRKKLLKILGEKFHIYSDDTQKNLIGYSYQKALKLKEDIRVYTDESESEEIMRIKARNIMDLSGKYDFTDSKTGESLGGITRHLRKSLFQDSYSIYDQDNQVYGEIKEDSLFKSLIRRLPIPFMSLVFPQVFSMNVQGHSSITFTQKMNPMIQKLTVQIPDENQFDRRVVLGLSLIHI